VLGQASDLKRENVGGKPSFTDHEGRENWIKRREAMPQNNCKLKHLHHWTSKIMSLFSSALRTWSDM
jgi:hypothetical protein